MSASEGRTARPAERVAVDPSADRAGIIEAVLGSLNEAVFVVRPSDRVVVMANPAAERLFATPAEALVGKPTRSLYASDAAHRHLAERSEAVLNEGRAYRGEHIFQRASGETFEAEVTITPVRSGAWRKGVVTVLRDISELRRVEAVSDEALATLRERVKGLHAIHRAATVLVDQQSSMESVLTRIAVALPAAWQYPESAVACITYGGLRVATDGYRETEWKQTAEFSGSRGDMGAVTVCYLRSFPDRDEGPFFAEERELLHTLAFLLQSYCRAREQHEEAERDRDRFRKLFRTGPVAMSLTAADTGGFVDVNERMAELTGYTPSELLGRTSVDLGLFSAEENDRLQRMLEEHGGAEGVRLEFLRRGVEPRVALGSMQRISIEGRDLWFTSMLDATAQARVEEERTHLAEHARTLERLGEIGNLAGGVAHDFNNLLLPILINVELAIPEAMGEGRARLEEIQDAALRGRELTKKLLAVGRRQALHVGSVDLNELVRAAEPILRRIVPESIAMEIAPCAEEVCASADMTLLEQILVNLVVNARDAIGRDGKIRIATLAGAEGGGEGTPASIELGADTPSSDLVWLEVSDDGPGIPPETRARMFEPFFTTKGGSGTGLGLATVLGIVRQHGGRIRVDTEMGAGTRFQIGLPRGDPSPPPGDTKAETRAGLGPEVGRDRTVLVVEDDPAVRRVTVRALGAFGFTVVQASDAKEALARLNRASHGIDLVVSDMVMPGMTGLELREALRGVAPHLPVVFVSGYSAKVLADHGVDRDSVRIVEKPFSPESLVRAVLDTLRETPPDGDAP